MSQCHCCAYKTGAAANLEVNNMLRGAICALGAIPFFCHDSLGWKESGGYDYKVDQALSYLLNRNKLREFFAKHDITDTNLQDRAKELSKTIKVCEGWRQAIARLKASGWFDNHDATTYRRYMAERAVAAIEDFIDPEAPPPDKEEYRKERERSKRSRRGYFVGIPECGMSLAVYPKADTDQDDFESDQLGG